jgi:sugar (pentulose or hexulose) kinase
MFLGLDFGSSGVRACVIDHKESVVWQRRHSFDDPSSQTPREWRMALYDMLHHLPHGIRRTLQGVSVDGTSSTAMLCNAALEPCSPVLFYHDHRAVDQALRLRGIAPANHIVCAATSGLAKFLWLTEGAGIDHASYFVHQSDWLTALLSGEPGISDYHNALKTGYDIENLRWPDWLLDLPHSNLLPVVLSPGQAIGKIRSDMASRFGINPLCTIHAGTTDSTAGFIASRTTEPGVGVTTLGSTLVVKELANKRAEAPEFGVYSHRYGNLWLVGGASNAGAGIFRQYFDDAQLEALSARIDPTRESMLDYYPLPRPGERFPVNDAFLPPRVAPRPPDDVEFLHGLLQGLARIEKAGYDRLAALGAPQIARILTNGGGARNPAWTRIRERSIGVPVSSVNHPEAAYGSALLCLAGLA